MEKRERQFYPRYGVAGPAGDTNIRFYPSISANKTITNSNYSNDNLTCGYNMHMYYTRRV